MSDRVAAFLYETYYPPGIFGSFAGVYCNWKEAVQTLKGHSKENLETMNLETLEIRRFRWKSLYNYHQVSSYPERGKETLTHSWDKNAPVIDLVWDGEYRRYGQHNNALLEAGEWESLE